MTYPGLRDPNQESVGSCTPVSSSRRQGMAETSATEGTHAASLLTSRYGHRTGGEDRSDPPREARISDRSRIDPQTRALECGREWVPRRPRDDGYPDRRCARHGGYRRGAHLHTRWHCRRPGFPGRRDAVSLRRVLAGKSASHEPSGCLGQGLRASGQRSPRSHRAGGKSRPDHRGSADFTDRSARDESLVHQSHLLDTDGRLATQDATTQMDAATAATYALQPAAVSEEVEEEVGS